MEIILNTVIEYALEVLGILIITLIGYFGTKLVNKLKEKEGLENIALATQEVISAVQATVFELQQTLVKDWKKNQEGKLTEEQVALLKDKVVSITLAKLGTPILSLLEGAKVDIVVLITSSAEACILEMKGEV